MKEGSVAQGGDHKEYIEGRGCNNRDRNKATTQIVKSTSSVATQALQKVQKAKRKHKAIGTLHFKHMHAFHVKIYKILGNNNKELQKNV